MFRGDREDSWDIVGIFGRVSIFRLFRNKFSYIVYLRIDLELYFFYRVGNMVFVVYN